MYSKHQNTFQSDSPFTKPLNLRFLLPPLILRHYTVCHLDQNFSKSIIGFQKVKVLNY